MFKKRVLLTRNCNLRFSMVFLIALFCFFSGRSQELPRIRVLSTGGTIAHLPDRYISGEQLVRDIPQLAEHVRLEVEEVTRIPSSEVGPDLWLKLARRVNEVYSEDRDLAGIVITHGSNTVTETAYFLNLTVKDRRPVVLTAAQRLHGSLSADGPHNLVDAVRVAAHPPSRGRGVLLVANGEINAARDVTKTITYRLETYESRDLGSLGYVDSDQVVFYRSVEAKHTHQSEFEVSSIEELPRVDIVYAAAGIDGKIVKGIVASSGPRGIVVAGFPTGETHPAMEAELEKAAGSPTFMPATGRVPTGSVEIT
jgi:L-asparaginase